MSGPAASGAPPRVFVHLDHGRSPARWHARFERGEVWEEWPYGYEHARGPVQLAFSKDRDESRFVELARKGVYWALGFDLVHALRNRRGLATADVVWAHTEHEHLAARLVLKLTGASSTPIVAQSVWLWDEWDAANPIRRRLARLLLRGPGVHTTLSRLNADKAASELPGAEVRVVPYGTEQIRFTAPVTREPGTGETRVVAPGNDRDRDWATLIEAARRDPRLTVRILSRRITAKDVADVPNVTVERSRSILEMQQHYAWADVVAVPIRPNLHASGITVVMEALNLGVPVVVTDVGGVRDYFADDVRYAVSGDSVGLAVALHEAGAERDSESRRGLGQEFIRARGLTARDYAERHRVLTDHLLGHPSDLDAVERFAPLPRGGAT